ncbi:MAG: biosynthetic arginine decarboxylase [Proteobacteria bacterium]|nr:biosynthetic arginine decarboxylase [Pseudomonadota bacterium]
MSADPLRHNALLDGAWTADDARALYGLEDWGKGYFRISPTGHLTICPTRQPERGIDVWEVVEGLRERGINPPVLLRFPDLARDRLHELRQAFDAAIEENQYQGGYCFVYPIKVNQERDVCEEIRNIGAQLGYGLEAGSKPELLAVLAMTVGHNDMPIVCNGFKDHEYIETVVLATKLGRRIIPVVERFNELELIIEQAQRHQTRPLVGLRIKPAARSTGKWASSSGMRSKFGLTAAEALRVIEELERHGMLDCLKMVHFHLGSQVSDIRRLKSAVTELAYFYTELRRLGAGIEYIDVGGGLGVDYDGSSSVFESSVNYSIREYASDLIYRIKTVCDDAGVPHPTIFSESGRAMVAYSTVLVFDVVGRSHFDSEPDIEAIRARVAAEDDPPQPVLDLLDAFESITDRRLSEAFHDAVQARDEAMNLFSLGYLTLPMRADAEKLFWAIGRQILARAEKRGELPEELSDLREGLSDTYYCNFSVFQSLPDAWAVDQLFPILPLHRLNERPTRAATLADITCDSDGKVDNFVDRRDIKRTLELHETQGDERYTLAACLVGAYQEVLGDLHNLFGDNHVVRVSLDAEGSWSIDEVIEGDSVREVLAYVGYSGGEMVRTMRQDVERALRASTLSVAEGRSLLEFYESGMAGYTYLE